MTIRFRCSVCNKLLKAPDDGLGRKGKCPHCGIMVRVPGEKYHSADINSIRLSSQVPVNDEPGIQKQESKLKKETNGNTAPMKEKKPH